MFDIGFWELIILFGLGLLVLGPERLPRVAMQIGNWAGQARRMARTLTTQIRDELDMDATQPFDPSRYRTPPKQQNYSRPGMDDLKPGASADEHHADAPGSAQDTASAPEGDPDQRPDTQPPHG